MPSRKLPQVADVVEISPPETIQQLRIKMDQYQPQVKILSPAADQLIKDDRVSVRFEVKDLPIFKDKTLGLGPHLHVFLDNQPYQAVYDLSQPLVFKEVAPGTHTIRVVAARPWFESFKNPEAYAQVTFHIFIQTEENKPTPHQPLLTYSQPQGSFGTETVLLDFYLSPSPASTSPNNQAANWQVLVSINGSSFYVEDWQPLYIQGLKPGKNWVRLQLMDRQGRKIDNAFNDTIRVVELREQGEDPFSRLMRGDLSAIEAGGMIDPNYKRPQPPAIKSAEPPQPSAAPLPTPAPELQEPAVKVPQKIEKQTPQVTPATALPISPQPLTTQSPTAKSKVPPTKSEDIKTKNLDKIESLEEPLQPKSVETPKATKPQEKSVPKVKPDSSRSQPQKPESSQSKQAPTPASSSKPTIEAPPPKAEATRSKTAAPSVKEDQKPLLPSPTSKDRMPSSTPKLEDQEPKANETITKPPVVKSAPTMQEKLKPSSGSVKAKADKEDAPADRSKPATASPRPSVADPRPPQDIETPKTPAQDQSLQLKAKARQLWDKIRPSQGQLEQPKPLPVVPLEHQEPVKAKNL
ncbi:MAG: hypothetical protein HC790_04755 [Acaryochloridaceae cyanobacterium CSU_3_4]|nr:hypothetical protein [Acaryochloridaceae cyanobacterium CSU_3_4]